MQYSGSKSSSLTIDVNVTSDVYIVKDKTGDPNNFVHDMSFKNVIGKMTFNADGLGLTSDKGYSVALYVSAIDENANELLYAGV